MTVHYVPVAAYPNRAAFRRNSRDSLMHLEGNRYLLALTSHCFQASPLIDKIDRSYTLLAYETDVFSLGQCEPQRIGDQRLPLACLVIVLPLLTVAAAAPWRTEVLPSAFGATCEFLCFAAHRSVKAENSNIVNLHNLILPKANMASEVAAERK